MQNIQMKYFKEIKYKNYYIHFLIEIKVNELNQDYIFAQKKKKNRMYFHCSMVFFYFVLTTIIYDANLNFIYGLKQSIVIQDVYISFLIT